MRLKIWFLLIALIIVMPGLCNAWNYPRDGKFKRLSPSSDSWYFVDDVNWDIKNPDKWQHFSGCYVSQKLLSKHMNKYLSALVIMSVGVYKEYEDAYREGWSSRDLTADLLGIVSAIYDKPTTRILCSYDREKVMLHLILPLK